MLGNRLYKNTPEGFRGYTQMWIYNDVIYRLLQGEMRWDGIRVLYDMLWLPKPLVTEACMPFSSLLNVHSSSELSLSTSIQ